MVSVVAGVQAAFVGVLLMITQVLMMNKAKPHLLWLMLHTVVTHPYTKIVLTVL